MKLYNTIYIGGWSLLLVFIFLTTANATWISYEDSNLTTLLGSWNGSANLTDGNWSSYGFAVKNSGTARILESYNTTKNPLAALIKINLGSCGGAIGCSPNMTKYLPTTCFNTTNSTLNMSSLTTIPEGVGLTSLRGTGYCHTSTNSWYKLYDTGSSETLVTNWIYETNISWDVGALTFVAPTPNNNTNSNNTNYLFVNVSSTYEGVDNCFLDLNGTNISMTKVNNQSFYLNNTLVNGSYPYMAWCNHSVTGLWDSTEHRNYTINTSTPDTIPPIITLLIPTNNTAYSATLAGASVTVTAFTGEAIDECWWDYTYEAMPDLDFNFTSTNGGVPYYQNKFTGTLPSAGGSRCWYMRCNDTIGNAMANATELCLSVSSAVGGGGGGAPGTTTGDNFILYRPGGEAPCVGIDYCYNSVTFDSTTGTYSPIKLRSCANRIQAARDGFYTVCNIANHPSTLALSVDGYTTSYGSSDDFLSLNTTKLEIVNGTCKSFQVKAKYPSGAVGTFSNSDAHAFVITISGVEKVITIPVEEMKPDCPAIETVLFENICLGDICMPPTVWFLGIFVVVVIFLANRR